MDSATLADRQSWLENRRSGLGASESAAALGVSPYKSRFQLWAEKVGLAEAANLDDVEHVQWGLRLEKPIAEAFSERTGRSIIMHPQHTVVRHPSIPWMLCTPDAEDSAGRIVQIKTCNAFALKDWETEPPLPYQVQLQHELEVTRRSHGTLVVLIGGQRLKWFDCERNERFAKALVEKLAAFWHLVQNHIPPEVDGSWSTRDVLRMIYPREDGYAVDLPAEAEEWDRQLVQAKADIKDAEARKTAAENKIKAAIGLAYCGNLPGGGAYTWKEQQREGYWVDDTAFRVLKRVKTGAKR